MQREAFRNFLTSATFGHFSNRKVAEGRKDVFEFFSSKFFCVFAVRFFNSRGAKGRKVVF